MLILLSPLYIQLIRITFTLIIIAIFVITTLIVKPLSVVLNRAPTHSHPLLPTPTHSHPLLPTAIVSRPFSPTSTHLQSTLTHFQTTRTNRD